MRSHRFFIVSLLVMGSFFPLRLFAQVAVIGMVDSRISSKNYQKADRFLAKALRDELHLSPVSKEDLSRAILEHLAKDLKEEISAAMEHFYHFRFVQAERILEGRDDPEALKVKALISYSRGDEHQAADDLRKLLKIEPGAAFSERDFPPRLISFFRAIQKEGKVRADHGIVMSEKFIDSWLARFRKLADRMHWKLALVYRLEPIGWNYKMTGYLLSGGEEKTRIRMVEMVSLADLEKGAKVLSKSLFIIDSHGKLK